MTKTAKIPNVPRPDRDPLSKMEQVYLGVLRHWWKHRSRAPTIKELVKICKPVRSTTAIRAALLSAEAKGYTRRDDHGRFEVIE